MGSSLPAAALAVDSPGPTSLPALGVVDLSGVTDVDVRAVRAIDAALKERRRAGALLVVACPFGAVHTTLVAAGLATAVVSTVAAARLTWSGVSVA